MTGILTTELHKTAFYSVQREVTCSWTEFDRWAWASDFGDPVAEHLAARNGCIMWDEAALPKWYLLGRDAMALADAVFSNHMAALEVGQARYGALCDEHGKMINDGIVFKLAEDHCFSITNNHSDLSQFQKVAADRGFEVGIEERNTAMPHFQVQGPMSREVLGPITEGADVARLGYFRFVPEGATVGGVPVILSRTGFTGELGFELYCRPEDAEALWRTVLKAGEPYGIRPIGLKAIESLRIESGLLFPNVEYFPHETDPFEVRLDKVVKLDKPGDFVGRDALRRIARGGTARLLATLRIEGQEVPKRGAGVTADGRAMGIVRSAAWSPTFGEVIALAAINREFDQVGREVAVELGGEMARAQVARFPLYDPERKRPRAVVR